MAEKKKKEKKEKKPGFLRRLITKTLLFVFIIALSIALAGVGHFAYKNDRMPNSEADFWTIARTLTQVFDESKKIAKSRITELEKKWKLEEKATKISKNWDQMIKQYEDTFDSSKGEDEERKLLRQKITEVESTPTKKKHTTKVSTTSTPSTTTPEANPTATTTTPTEGKKPSPKKVITPVPVPGKTPEKENTLPEGPSIAKTNPSSTPLVTSPVKGAETVLSGAEKSDRRKILGLLKEGTREFQQGRVFYRQAYQTNDSKHLKKAQEHFRKALALLEEARDLEKDSGKKEKIEELITLTGSHIADCVRMGKM